MENKKMSLWKKVLIVILFLLLVLIILTTRKVMIISDLANKSKVYDSKTNTEYVDNVVLILFDEGVTDTRRNEIISKKPFCNEPIELIDLFGSYCAADKNSDNSRFNILSAIVSFATAINAEREDEQIEVGIITPYAAQTRLVRALILDYRKK